MNSKDTSNNSPLTQQVWHIYICTSLPRGHPLMMSRKFRDLCDPLPSVSFKNGCFAQNFKLSVVKVSTPSPT